MGLGTQAAETHGPRNEVPEDALDALDLLQRDALRLPEAEESPQCAQVPGLVIDQLTVLFEAPVVPLLDRLPEGGETLRRPQVGFAVLPVLVLAARGQEGSPSVGRPGPPDRFLSDLGQPDAADPGDGPGEKFVEERPVQPHGLEGLGGAVAAQRGNAQFRHDFEQSLLHGVDVVARRRDGIHADGPGAGERRHGLKGKIGVDRRRAVTQQQCEMHHLAYLAGLDDDPGLGPQVVLDQRPVDRGAGQQARDRRLTRGQFPVREDQDALAARGRLHGAGGQSFESLTQGMFAARGIETASQHP